MMHYGSQQYSYIYLTTKMIVVKIGYVIPRAVIDWPLYIDISIMSVSMI